MQKVVDELASNNQNKIFLFGGGKEETDKLNALSKQRVNIVVVAGKLKFNQELQLISNLDVMLSMDLGNAHDCRNALRKSYYTLGINTSFCRFCTIHQPRKLFNF
jgi:siroheme synthase (precorrin-2 oxidase/ferrochelatase)